MYYCNVYVKNFYIICYLVFKIKDIEITIILVGLGNVQI